MNRPSIANAISLACAALLGTSANPTNPRVHEINTSLGIDPFGMMFAPPAELQRGHDTNPFRRAKATGKHARIRQKQNRSRRRSLRRA